MVNCTRGVAVAVDGLSHRCRSAEQWSGGGIFRRIVIALRKFVYLFDIDLEWRISIGVDG